MLIRPAHGWDPVVEVHTLRQVMDYLRTHYGFWNPKHENVTIRPHEGYARYGWDTHLICVDGRAALYSDAGPLMVDPGCADLKRDDRASLRLRAATCLKLSREKESL